VVACGTVFLLVARKAVGPASVYTLVWRALAVHGGVSRADNRVSIADCAARPLTYRDAAVLGWDGQVRWQLTSRVRAGN
jgi:hypothetical protein